jgi:hypothetical protein
MFCTNQCFHLGRSRLLVRNPQVMDRLRNEVSSVMGDQVHPSREQIRKMPYLANVITESKLNLLPLLPY